MKMRDFHATEDKPPEPSAVIMSICWLDADIKARAHPPLAYLNHVAITTQAKGTDTLGIHAPIKERS